MTRPLVMSARVATSLVAVGVVTTLLLRLDRANPITVALSYLILVLLIATRWGIASSTVVCLAAVACFNFFFLPPVGTWTITDPQNWIALGAFLVTAVVVSQLSGRARARAIDALDRQRDLERLYALSRALLLADHAGPAQPTVAQRIAETFEIPAVALYDARADLVSRGGGGDLPGVETALRDVARQAVTIHNPAGPTVVAIRLGGAPVGSLALAADHLSDTVLQSIANLVAIDLERARARQAAALADAARQSGELRASILDALAHEFKTPLTSLKVAASDLHDAPALASHERELVGIIEEDAARLQALVTDVVRMLRVDAGDFVVHRHRHQLADIARTALAQFARRLEGRHVVALVPDTVYLVVDAELMGLALRQLIDNAIKYSPETSTIEIRAEVTDAVRLSVHNTGAPIPAGDVDRLFERFYRGSTARQVPGTGIGLSIVQQIARAHGGTLTASSSVAAGTTFTIVLPMEALT